MSTTEFQALAAERPAAISNDHKLIALGLLNAWAIGQPPQEAIAGVAYLVAQIIALIAQADAGPATNA